eukprot:g3097.t1
MRRAQFVGSMASLVLQMPTDPPTDILHALVTSVQSLIMQFPSLYEGRRDYVCATLSRTFACLTGKGGGALGALMQETVGDGLVRTLSHVTDEDVRRSGELNPFFDESTGLPDRRLLFVYLPMWRALLESSKVERAIAKWGTSLSDSRGLPRLIFSHLMTHVLRMLDKLDLRTQTLPSSSRGEDDAASKARKVPSVPKDYSLFLNIVTFCIEIFPTCSEDLIDSWLHPFLSQLIRMDRKYSSEVSGIYKLVEVALDVSRESDAFKSSFSPKGGSSQECREVVRSFISRLLDRVPQLVDELLLSALRCVLSCPESIVRIIGFARFGPALVQALTLGLQHVPIAMLGIRTLERWTEGNVEHLEALLPRVLPALEPYLGATFSSRGIASESDRTDTEGASGQSPSRSHVEFKWKRDIKQNDNRRRKRGTSSKSASASIGMNGGVRAVQSRVLRLLGRLGGRSRFVVGTVTSGSQLRSLSKGLRWVSRDSLLMRGVPISADTSDGMVLAISEFFPSVVRLATQSLHRQTKVVACEVLHSFVIYLIGSDNNSSQEVSSDSLKIMKRLFGDLVRLATDVEQVSRKLFAPLVMQLVRWYSRQRTLTVQGPQPALLLLDAIVEGVGSPSDGAMREYCSKCLAEFFKWSVKQATTKELTRTHTVTVRSLLRRIFSLLRHPQSFKRYGAALTLGRLYVDLREEEKLTDMYVMEIVHHLLSSFRLSGEKTRGLSSASPSGGASAVDFESGVEVVAVTQKALRHMLKIIRAPLVASRLRKRSRERPMYSEGLSDLVDWVFSQCCVSETAARRAAMECFGVLVRLLALTNDNGREWFEKMDASGVSLMSREIEIVRRGPPPPLLVADVRGDLSAEGVVHLRSRLVAIAKWSATLAAIIDKCHWLLSFESVDFVSLLSKSIDTNDKEDSNRSRKRQRQGASSKVSESKTREVVRRGSKFAPLIECLRSYFARINEELETRLVTSFDDGVSGVISSELLSSVLAEQRHASHRSLVLLWRSMNFLDSIMRNQKGAAYVAEASIVSTQFLRVLFASILVPHLVLPIGTTPGFFSGFAREDYDRLIAASSRLASRILQNSFKVFRSVETEGPAVLRKLINVSSVTNILTYHAEQSKFGSFRSNLIRGYSVLCRAGWSRFRLWERPNSSAGSFVGRDAVLTHIVEQLRRVPTPSSPTSSMIHRGLLRLAIRMGWPLVRASDDTRSEDSLLGQLLSTRTLDNCADASSNDGSTSVGAHFYHHFRGVLLDHLSAASTDEWAIASERVTSACLDKIPPAHAWEIYAAMLKMAKESQSRFEKANQSMWRLFRAWLPSGTSPKPSNWTLILSAIQDLLVESSTSTQLSVYVRFSDAILYALRELLDFAVPSDIKVRSLNLLSRILAISNDTLSSTRRNTIMAAENGAVEKIHRVISQYFPTSSKVIEKNSKEYAEYETVLRAVLNYVKRTASLPIFESLCTTVLNERNHRYERRISEALSAMLDIVTARSVVKTNSLWRFCIQKTSKMNAETVVLHRNLFRFVCIPLLSKIDSTRALKLVMTRDNVSGESVIVSLFKTLKRPFAKRPDIDTILAEQKIASFELLTTLYRLVPPAKINSEITPLVVKGSGVKANAFTVQLCQMSRRVVVNCVDAVIETSVRHQVVCTAFNCLATVVSETQKDKRFFEGLIFKENASRNERMWEHIAMSDDHRYRFEVETSYEQVDWAVLQRGALVRLEHCRRHDGIDEYDDASDLKARSSQYLADSSLTQHAVSRRDEEIGNLDTESFRASDALAESEKSPDVVEAVDVHTLLAEKSGHERATRLESIFELDELNSHPCMVVILRVLDRMKELFHVASNTEEKCTDMPKWMRSMHTAYTRSTASLNTKLLICKVVLNRPEMFEAFTNQWLKPCLDCALALEARAGTSCLVGGFHSFYREMCWMFVTRWRECVPSTSSDIVSASNFVKLLFNCSFDNNVSVRRSNIELIVALLGKWKDCGLSLSMIEPYKLVTYEKKAREGSYSTSGTFAVAMRRITGLQIFAGCVANNLAVHNGSGGGGGLPYEKGGLKHEMLRNVIEKNLRYESGRGTKAVYEAAAGLCGLLFRASRTSGEDAMNAADSKELRKRVAAIFRAMYSSRDMNRFLRCLRAVAEHDPSFVFEGMFESQVEALLSTASGEHLQLSVEIMCCRLGVYDASEAAENSARLYSMCVASRRALHDARRPATQMAALALVDSAIHLAPSLLFKVLLDEGGEVHVPSIFRDHKVESCRRRYFAFLVKLLGRESVWKESSTQRHRSAICRLTLPALSDESDEIKDSILTFWHDSLAAEKKDRLVRILSDMYDPSHEDGWLRSAAFLLLKGAERSKKCEEKIFKQPLGRSAGTYSKIAIDGSWTQGMSTMRPRFAEYALSQDPSQMSGGAVRATQAPLWMPTQIDSDGGAGFATAWNDSQRFSSYAATGNRTQSLSGGMFGSLTPMAQVLATQRSFNKNSNETTKVSSTGANRILPPVPRFRKRRRHPKDEVAYRRHTEGYTFARRNATKRRQEEARRRRMQLQRRSTVHVFRSYRRGELPDIQIKWKDVLDPLRGLCALNTDVASVLLVSTTREVFETCQDARILLQAAVSNIIVRTTGAPAILTLAQNLCDVSRNHDVDVNVVVQKSTMSASYHSCALLLENQLLRETKSSSLSASASMSASASVTQSPYVTSSQSTCVSSITGAGGSTREMDTISGLVSIYSKLQMDDIVTSLVASCATKDESRIAVAMEQANNIRAADKLYQNLIYGDEEEGDAAATSTTVDVTSIEEDWWEAGRMRCMELLQRWSKVYENATMDFENASEEDVLDVGDENVRCKRLVRYMSKKDQRENASAFVKAALRLGPSTRKELLAFSSICKEPWLERDFGAEIATAHALDGDFKRAAAIVDFFNRSFLKRWSQLHPLATEARCEELRKLQAIAEVRDFIDVMSGAGAERSTRIVTVWEQRFPSVRFDTAKIWELVITSRIEFMRLMQQRIKETSNARPTLAQRRLIERLETAQWTALLRGADGMREQGLLGVSDKYMRRAATDYAADSLRVLETLVRLNTAFSRRYAAEGRHSAETERLQSSIKAIRARKDKFASRETSQRASLLFLRAEAEAVMAKVHQGSNHREQHERTARDAFREYMNVETDTKLRARGAIAFAGFCDSVLRHNEDAKNASEWARIVVDQTLFSCRVLGAQATSRIPRLFELAGEFGASVTSVLDDKGSSVPVWLFLKYTAQIMALLPKKTDESASALRILERAASAYPQAVYYSFRISSEDCADMSCFGRLPALLRLPLLDRFVSAMERLHHPHLWWNIRESAPIVRLKAFVKAGRRKDALEMVNELERRCLSTRDCDGSYVYHWASVAGKELRPCVKNLRREIEKGSVSGVSKALLDAMRTARDFGPRGSKKDLLGRKFGLGYMRGGTSPLEWWSEFLADFDAAKHEDSTIEIPAQYGAATERPDPSRHAIVQGFDRELKVMTSKQLPKRILMRGSDERDRRYLVKGGEDLRLDQRIQELFGVMNDILNRDTSCSRRGLSIRTYTVVPMTSSVGLIEWVGKTETFSSIFEEALNSPSYTELSNRSSSSSGSSTRRRRIHLHTSESAVIFDRFLRKFGSDYHKMLAKATRKETVKAFEGSASRLPQALLRRKFLDMASSAESFMTFRGNFVNSMATFSVGSYILGIGDRHLGNFMLDVSSGSVVPIDFGVSFGTGLSLNVPELIPFRMTPQLTQVLEPLNTKHVWSQVMCNAMRALSAERDALIEMLEIFVKEPLLDWNKQVKRKDGRDNTGEDSKEERRSSWYPRKKVESTKRKLDQANPVHVMIEDEIRGNLSVRAKKAQSSIENILWGPQDAKRREHPRRCPSIESQVECLVEMATDPNILGRQWVGLRTWC